MYFYKICTDVFRIAFLINTEKILKIMEKTGKLVSADYTHMLISVALSHWQRR